MIKPRKWIRTSTRKHTSVVVGFRKGAAEPESSSVQPKSEEAEYFHRITCEAENNTHPRNYAIKSVPNPRLSALPSTVSDLDRFRQLPQPQHRDHSKQRSRRENHKRISPVINLRHQLDRNSRQQKPVS